MVYGPHVDNFLNETELLERAGAAVRVQDAAGLGATLARWARDPEARAQMGTQGGGPCRRSGAPPGPP